jgi:hypothetical protein
MAAPSTETQTAQRQAGTGGFGVGTVSSIPCRERETHEERGRPGSVPRRRVGCVARQRFAQIVPVPGASLGVRPRRPIRPLRLHPGAHVELGECVEVRKGRLFRRALRVDRGDRCPRARLRLVAGRRQDNVVVRARCRLWRLASRSRSSAPTATAVRRRGPVVRRVRTPGAKAVLGGARFNPGWATFASW